MLVYKVFTKPDFESFVSNGKTKGSHADLRDGFIHFSTREQLFSTIKKHFSFNKLVFVLAFEECSLKHKLRWESSRNLKLFPHYYGCLWNSQVLYSIQLET